MSVTKNYGRKSGSSISEYAFIAALIAGVGLTGSAFLGGEVNTLLSRLSNVMTTGQETSADNLGDHTATQSLNMSGFSIIGLASPTNDTDAATKAYVDTAIAGVPGSDDLGSHTASQNLILGSNWISGDGQNEGIFIDSGGNVGVGTSTPSTFFGSPSFIVGNGISGRSTTGLSSASGELATFVFDHGGIDGGNEWHINSHPSPLEQIRFWYAGADRFTFSTTGLGIGTSGPVRPLHIAGGSGSAVIRLQDTDSGLGIFEIRSLACKFHERAGGCGASL